jgi:hypothetical protein
MGRKDDGASFMKKVADIQEQIKERYVQLELNAKSMRIVNDRFLSSRIYYCKTGKCGF